ncbi:MAG: hypothetical protein U9N46_12275, partial [Euryarchaeota archaeon]|nr:hypothetical protein [Euryarchaeota archaeon]
SPIDICETRRIQRATYLLSIEDGVTKRNKNGKVLGCGTHPNTESFHHPTIHPHPVVADTVDTSLFYHIKRLFGFLLVNNELFRHTSVSTSLQIKNEYFIVSKVRCIISLR